MTASRVHAVVIGAGVNGLAAAAALGRAGRRVVVLERGDALGGQTRTDEFAPGFRAGPLDLDPGWVPPAVSRGLGLGLLERIHPEAPVTVVGDGPPLTLWRDPARAAEEIRRRSPRDAERWPGFTARLARLAGFLGEVYQLPPPNLDARGFREVLPYVGLARKFRRLGRADMVEFLRVMPMSVQELLDDWFEADAVKAAVAAGGIQDIQQGPRSGGTAFVLLHHLVGAPSGTVRGRGYWRAGPATLARALEDACRRHGVALRTGAPVGRVLVKDDAVTGVALASGEEIAAPVVLSTAGPGRTLLDLLDPVWLDPDLLHAIRSIKYRGCTGVVLYALDALPELPRHPDPAGALAGVVTLTPSLDGLERAYDAAKYGALAERPHVEFTVATLRWPDLAPPGRHVLVARVQWAPYALREGRWDPARRDALAARVTAAIGQVLPGFASRVLHRSALTPLDLEVRYGLSEGAVTHGALTLDQILFMRPVPGWAHYAMPVRGLYLGGAGAHPGPGVPGGAGWLAARRALRDGGRR